ncbi:DNA polymerase I [Flavisolibacter ginsenosidimutans]|uniref:DNA polymerase I n=1 Tax=Flavisolibacter ginsenosidimutans TaxID=661481 RepID=A0A5B8UMK1_9BACT|nr:DNA polymerase I [Flavisolibacter ginsenosidimutans]QEC57235.1 DNA polymerase I [Flavisolibacter ginsenosidimutans]
MDKRLFLLDAYALIFRAYYALIRAPRITSKGRNTNAQFGFTNTLVELINNQKPTHMAVCFDTGAPTERHTDFADYKANRQEAPEDLKEAIPDIKRILRGFNVPIIESDGYEADDVIGTLSKQAEALGYDVYMVTPDKDYGQLVSEKVKIYKPGYQGGEVEIMGPKEVCDKWCIPDVAHVVDILGLMGDAVDNIPGIAGVGQKTACKLITEYGSLEKILENADSIKGSLGEKVRAGREAAIMSKKLATIITSVPVEFHEEDFRLKELNKEGLKEIFTELEFKTFIKRILGEDGTDASAPKKQAAGVQTNLFGSDAATVEAPEENNVVAPGKNAQNTPHEYDAVESESEFKTLLDALSKQTEISFDTETTGIDANNALLVGMSFSIEPHRGWYVPLPTDNVAETKNILARFAHLFNDESKTWIGHNIKYDMLMLKWYGVELKGKLFDTMLAHYLIEPDGKSNMDWLSAKYLGYEPIHIEELISKKGKGQGSMKDVELEKIKEYAVEDADITLQFKSIFLPQLKKHEVKNVFNDVENPLVPVLVDMEFEGVRIDTAFLNEYSTVLETEARVHEEKVYETAGVRFNLGSPKQLGEVLFEKLKIDSGARKTKTGQYATGEDVLRKLAAEHKIVDDILAYREYTKLKSTYVDSLPLLINPKTGRIHTNFAQAVAVTGRLSSNNPNLQNIPIKTERGREIRKAFIPRDKAHTLLSADYSQIELRIVAALSGDKNMCDAFLQNKDVHTATAAKIYNVAEEAVTKEMRRKAKTTNFGIVYGQSSFGLADTLGISRSEAKTIIDNYKREFEGVTKYLDSMINFAREHGYVQTVMGRKRWLRDINSSNFTVRGYAERNAINSPIQGTAADMIKLAMIKIHEAFKQHKFVSKMILQVHDELVFDVVKDEVEKVKQVVLECMESAMTLPNGIPILAEVGVGENWLEAH